MVTTTLCLYSVRFSHEPDPHLNDNRIHWMNIVLHTARTSSLLYRRGRERKKEQIELWRALRFHSLLLFSLISFVYIRLFLFNCQQRWAKKATEKSVYLRLASCVQAFIIIIFELSWEFPLFLTWCWCSV